MASQVSRPATAFSNDRRGQRKPRQKAEVHLVWIRSLPSVIPGTGPVEAAHIRFADPRYAKPHVGLGEKPDDKWTVPLAADRHREQHAMNERVFWEDRGIDPVLVAALLWAHSGDDEAAVQIIRQARLIGRAR